jgi:hypothetical protein
MINVESPNNIINIINDNNINSFGPDNNRLDTSSISERNQEVYELLCKNKHDDINIYRYKFSNEFTDELFKFSKIHQYDNRKDYKEAWNIWTEDNNFIIREEIRRLTNLGYDGNVLDKMFKSSRYYFRKKTSEKKPPTERRNYITVQKELLSAMDDHIKTRINNKPSKGFDDFCQVNIDLLKEEVNIFCKNGLTDSSEIKKKIKKTYKNRYYLLTK